MTRSSPARSAVAGLAAVLAAGLAVSAALAPGGASATVPEPRGASSVAFLHAEAPPAGHTGGFGEADCTACHLDAGPNLPGGSLEVRGLPAGYRPGQRYELEVVLRAEGTERAGFQLALRRPDGTDAGVLAPLDGRVQILRPDTLPAAYAAQTGAGSRPDIPHEARWRLTWTAPQEGGMVRLHAAANSGNGDDSPLGDLVFTAEGESRPGS